VYGEQSSVNEHCFFLLSESSYQVWVRTRSFYQAGHGSIHFFMPFDFLSMRAFQQPQLGLPWAVVRLQASPGAFSGGYLARLSHLLGTANVVILGWVVNSHGSWY